MTKLVFDEVLKQIKTKMSISEIMNGRHRLDPFASAVSNLISNCIKAGTSFMMN